MFVKKIFALVTLAPFLFQSAANAQSGGNSYTTALGVKFYPGAGITLKHFIWSNAALGGIGYFWKDGIRISGLYEFHGDINGAPGLKWYVGGGAYIIVWNTEWKKIIQSELMAHP